jgi:NitT/TauT family transport system substrate-binding protein
MFRRPWFWYLLVALAAITVIAGAFVKRRAFEAPAISTNPFDGIVPTPRIAPTLFGRPTLRPQKTFVPVERTLLVDISEYAGYAGLIVANGGLRASERSLFFRDYGFKVELSKNEQEGWEALNDGRLAAMLTTADVAALYAPDLPAIIPVLVGYSRGADGIVVRQNISRFSELKGRVLATAQFSEAEFLVRYIARETGVPVRMMREIGDVPDPGAINLLFAVDGFSACDLLLYELIMNRNVIAGCSAWEPKTSEVVERSGGAAHILTTNRNLLIIADVLAVNAGFAAEHPEMVDGLVEGILRGNDLVRNSSESQLIVVADAFDWRREKARQELRNVHLANLPENIYFFSDPEEETGSFAHIYKAAIDAYGPQLSKSPPDRRLLLNLRPLRKIVESGKFRNQVASIERLRSLTRESEPFEGMPDPHPVTQVPHLPDVKFDVPLVSRPFAAPVQ